MTSFVKAALPHESKGPWLVATTWGLTGLATLFVGLRFYCRISRSRSFALDDQAILGAWALLVAQTAMATYNVHLGMGQHVFNLNPAYVSELAMISDFATIPAVLAVAVSKASAGISLLRLLEKWWLRLVVQIIIVTTVLSMTGIAVLTFVQCDPVSKHWNHQVPGVCWSPEVVPRYAVGAAIYSGVMDILLALIPWPLIMKLRMNKREKLGVAMALASMIFAGVASFAKATTLSTLSSTDPTYHIPRLIVAGTIEITVIMMAVCIPVLRVLLRDVQRTYMSSGSGRRETQTGRSRGSPPFSNAGSSKLGARSCPCSEDVQILMTGVKPVVVQEKSWAITYSPASGHFPTLDYSPATALPLSAGGRQSIRSLPCLRLLPSFGSAESTMSAVSIPAVSPREPPPARRHTTDWKVHLNLSPSAVRFDDILSRGRNHEENVRAESFV